MEYLQRYSATFICLLFANMTGFSCDVMHRSRNARVRRIAGGTEALAGEIPFQVFVLAKDMNNKIFQCGGALISSQWVVSAAHCYERRMWVIAGRNEISGLKISQMDPVVESYIHENYNEDIYGFNDILLLKIGRKLKMTDLVKTIALPDEKEIFVGQNCQVSGFGKINYGGPVSKMLRKANITVYLDDTCSAIFESNLGATYDRNKLLCAGEKLKIRDACEGDSGGPLVCGNKLAGIVSCGAAQPPGVYVQVTGFLDWIEEKISSSSKVTGVQDSGANLLFNKRCFHIIIHFILSLWFITEML